MLFAVRDLREGPTALEALPQLHVCGLPPTEAQQLLASTGSSHLADHISQRIVSETSGNPLALIELGRELTPEQLAGETSLPEPLPLPRALEAKFVRQVRSLPAPTQMLLLTAAADPTGDPALLWRAGERLGFGITAAAAAEAGDLVTFGPPVRFRHPLVRSAVYHSATLIERKRAHEALAEATDPSLDADRRAWHRAEASALPDEAVAAELERATDRAKSRGGWAASGAFLNASSSAHPRPGGTPAPPPGCCRSRDDGRRTTARPVAPGQPGRPARRPVRTRPGAPSPGRNPVRARRDRGDGLRPAGRGAGAGTP